MCVCLLQMKNPSFLFHIFAVVLFVNWIMRLLWLFCKIHFHAFVWFRSLHQSRISFSLNSLLYTYINLESLPCRFSFILSSSKYLSSAGENLNNIHMCLRWSILKMWHFCMCFSDSCKLCCHLCSTCSIQLSKFQFVAWQVLPHRDIHI